MIASAAHSDNAHGCLDGSYCRKQVEMAEKRVKMAEKHLCCSWLPDSTWTSVFVQGAFIQHFVVCGIRYFSWLSTHCSYHSPLLGGHFSRGLRFSIIIPDSAIQIYCRIYDKHAKFQSLAL